MVMRLSKTEMKILIYNKVKRGMAYDQARKEVARDIEQLEKMKAERKTKKKQEKDFAKEFKQLKEKKHEKT